MPCRKASNGCPPHPIMLGLAHALGTTCMRQCQCAPSICRRQQSMRKETPQAFDEEPAAATAVRAAAHVLACRGPSPGSGWPQLQGRASTSRPTLRVNSIAASSMSGASMSKPPCCCGSSLAIACTLSTPPMAASPALAAGHAALTGSALRGQHGAHDALL